MDQGDPASLNLNVFLHEGPLIKVSSSEPGNPSITIVDNVEAAGFVSSCLFSSTANLAALGNISPNERGLGMLWCT